MIDRNYCFIKCTDNAKYPESRKQAFLTVATIFSFGFGIDYMAAWVKKFALLVKEQLNLWFKYTHCSAVTRFFWNSSGTLSDKGVGGFPWPIYTIAFTSVLFFIFSYVVMFTFSPVTTRLLLSFAAQWCNVSSVPLKERESGLCS